MRVEEALGAYLKAAGTSCGSRFYLRKLPQNDDGAYIGAIPAATFGVTRTPNPTHDENDLGTKRIHDCAIEIMVVARDYNNADGRRLVVKAAREIEEAMRFFVGLRRGIDDDGEQWSVIIGPCLLDESDAPDWNETTQTWDVDLSFFCRATA